MSKRLCGHALDEVSATLRRHHLDRVIRWIDGKKLATLLSVARPRLAELLNLGDQPVATDEARR
ncbi:MAG: hypothetical protein HY908_30395 [Myxococcales bacterium]|nr:hypothetical protein [Myxococcales bacterium]